MGLQLPLHIKPNAPRTPAICREFAAHAQRMMQLRPDGHGFRKPSMRSSDCSLVEGYLVMAGDMEPPKPERSERSKRREADHKDYIARCKANPRRANGHRNRGHENPAWN